ncbi:hypothetical protein EON67_05170 [archaeon]|nr:MAG: hypothetical protein EON67_05170 [archaeon]
MQFNVCVCVRSCLQCVLAQNGVSALDPSEGGLLGEIGEVLHMVRTRAVATAAAAAARCD